MSKNQERVVMITGGNGGIGFATVQKLVGKGYRVILASRNQETSKKAIERIRNTNSDAKIETIPLDLASFESIRACASAFQAKGYPLHLLINNAGQMFDSKEGRFTTDGFEMTFGVNHLGHFLLTNLLIDNLKASAPARVITVSSSLHNPELKQGPPPDFDYDNLKAEKYFDAQVFYKNSKLANMWFAYELNRLLAGTGVTSNAVCPGFVPAAIGARRKSPFERFFYSQFLARMPFARSLDEASDSYIVAATKPKFASVGGKFIVDGEEKKSSEESYNEEKAQILWEKSLGWCGLGAE